jgi:folate-binding Fe-S cluster repair protein YgfZ
LIEVDVKEAERLAKHIKRYKLRAKFEVRVLEEGESGVWSHWDDGGHALSDGTSTGGGEIGCLDTRAPGFFLQVRNQKLMWLRARKMRIGSGGI